MSFNRSIANPETQPKGKPKRHAISPKVDQCENRLRERLTMDNAVDAAVLTAHQYAAWCKMTAELGRSTYHKMKRQVRDRGAEGLLDLSHFQQMQALNSQYNALQHISNMSGSSSGSCPVVFCGDAVLGGAGGYCGGGGAGQQHPGNANANSIINNSIANLRRAGRRIICPRSTLLCRRWMAPVPTRRGSVLTHNFPSERVRPAL